MARSERRKRRRHEGPIPAHPYRDSAIVYGVLAFVLVIVAALTGGDVVRAVIVAIAFFAVATAWSAWRFRGRIRARAKHGAAGVDESGRDRVDGDPDAVEVSERAER